MKYQVTGLENQSILFICDMGRADLLREFLEGELIETLGFTPTLQECEDDELEIYLHTDSYEDLDSEQLAKIEEIGITEFNSLSVICSLLSIKIEQVTQ